MKARNFIFNWVLKNKLAIGSAPKKEEDFKLLEKNNIDFILNLCNAEEYMPNDYLKNNFHLLNYPLPDHKYEDEISLKNIKDCLKIIEANIKEKQIFVHCLASIERSPLICMAWLISHKKISFENAYIYLSQTHKKSNPLKKQLDLLIANQYNI